ncbi:MAG: amidohydrolase family protein [Blastocatellia bacterium]
MKLHIPPLTVLFLSLWLALPLAAQTRTTYFKCRLLINPATGQTIDNAVVEVSGGKILRIGQFTPPASASVVDVSDKYIIPGLIDTHAHLYTNLTFGHSTNEALPFLFLANGVTSILSPGSGNPEGDIALKNRIDSGRAIGPRIFLAGEYIDMEPLRVPWMEAVRSEAEAKAKLDYWFARGATAVKVYTGAKGDILRAVIQHAHLRGAKVNGHLEDTSWAEAIAMGIDVLHHGIYSFPELMPAGIPAQAIGMINFAPPEYDKYYQAIVDVDLNAPEVQSVFAAAAAAKVVFVPTVVALTPPDAVKDRMSEQQPFYAAEAWKKVEGRFNAEKRKYAVLLAQKNIEFVRAAHKAGVMLAIGTDLTNLQILPGWSLYREMELFAEAGMKPMDVLKAATYNGAWALGRADWIGSLEAGKAADFVILNASPLDNISNVRAVHRVVKGGVIHNPEEVLKSVKGRIH